MVVERRRHLRHKVHSPAYASIGAGVGGVVLDANERGASVESVARLAPQSFVDLRLDLLETHSSAVTPARVAWCDDGRAGLEFLNLTGESRRQLQQWLLLNALLASETAGQLAQAAQPPAAEQFPSHPDTGNSAFRLAAEHALAVTGAQGAAVALAESGELVCRASAGGIAPPRGTHLDTQTGISGACIREGRWLRCDDPNLDPHVDRESCQALGINSVLAVPIRERETVLGLIEVFSGQAYAFSESHCLALQTLAESVALALKPKDAEAAPAEAVTETPKEVSPTPTAETVRAQSTLLGQAAEAAPAPETQRAEVTAAPPPGAMAAVATATAVAPEAALPTATEPLPVSASTMEQQVARAGAGERIVLLGLVAALLIVGLWFVLGRDSGELKRVDAAESTSVRPSALEQPASSASAENLAPALRELRQRAQSGDSEAQFEIGAKYATGEDAPQDYAEAVKWFTRSAEGGQVLAAATLGAYYWAGRGVPQDDVSAYMWSSIARLGGDEASRYRLSILRAHMTEQQIMEGEKRTARWRQAHLSQPVATRFTAN